MEKLFEPDPATPGGYFDRIRRGEAPEQGEAEPAGPADVTEADADQEPAGEEPAVLPIEPVPVESLAPYMPDPTRPYWWFSSTALPERKLAAGRAVREAKGSRLPPDADYWCHEGDPCWVKVDRDLIPKPEVFKKPKKPKAPKRGEAA